MIEQIIKEILEELTGTAQIEAPKCSPFVGKECMIRTYSAGVHFGEVTFHDKKEVILKDAYRVYYWKGACSLSQLAMEGSKERSDCKIAVKVDEIYLSEAIEIIPMTKEAYENLTEGELWKK